MGLWNLLLLQTFQILKSSSKSFFFLTCTGASIGQVRRDGDCPALVHTHALQTFVNAGDESTLTQQTDLCGSSLMAVKKHKRMSKTKRMSEVGQLRLEETKLHLQGMHFQVVNCKLVLKCRSSPQHLHISKRHCCCSRTLNLVLRPVRCNYQLCEQMKQN